MALNLKTVSDDELLTQTKSAVTQELETTARVLHYLHEIERRRLHLTRGFSSLHEYCVRELKYSDGGAHRRISAMRLMVDAPRVRELVEQGRLSLSTAAQLQNFFRAERRDHKSYGVEQKLDIVQQAEGKSRREVEKVLVAISPGNRSLQRNSDSQRVISETETALRLVFNSAQLAKLKRFRECTSHRNAGAKTAEVIEHALDLALARVDPDQKKRRASPAKLQKVEKLVTAERPVTAVAREKPVSEKQVSQVPQKQAVVESLGMSEESQEASPEKFEVKSINRPIRKSGPSRYIAVLTRRKLHAQAQGQCMYRDPLTQRRCEAKSFLEIDHVLPYALEGSSDFENLRLICRAHNQLQAILVYGNSKMAPYLAPL